MANKITKVQMFNMIKALEDVQANADMVAFLDHEIELLSKKSARKAKTDEELDAERQLFNEVVSALADGKARTITEIQKSSDILGNFSNQRVVSIVKKMITNGDVVKITDKKKSTFKLV